MQNSTLVTSKDNRQISKVHGQNLFGNANNDVKLFLAKNKLMNFFPRHLTYFFKNLELDEIYYGNLKKITKQDLKEFGDKIKNLNLHNNDIEVLEENLFQFNNNLVEIQFSTTKLNISAAAYLINCQS